MAEDLIVSSELTKEEKYKTLLPQLKALVDGETDAIANLANIAAALKTTFNFWWVGFYLIKNNELVLGPFQGPVACTRIAKGKGVCGSSWQKKEVIIVPDVDQFLGHIACSSASKSEIVLPRLNSQNEVEMVLDVDSEFLNHFDETDQNYLLKIIQLIPTLN
ncbi:MAG: Free methionine-R-sulfoxide reductase [Flavobacteriales bacterium]|nr:Free methionine-R-sulfoxide reductase [Flavobacteriales bacterium]